MPPIFWGKADITSKLLTRDEARRIASNIAKLAESAERRFLPADNSPQRQKDRAMPRGKSADVTT
jgi:uncharacterized ferredoxin-like protein